MAVPYRVLEDLAAFDIAISRRFRFRTIAVLCTDEASEVSSRFVRDRFAAIDELTGPEILAVTLEEPKGGYWQYLNQSAESTEHDRRSVHDLLAELNRGIRTKEGLSREALSYRGVAPPPSRSHLRDVVARLHLEMMEPPFVLLFAVPRRNATIWNARAYAMLGLTEASFAEPRAAYALIEALFAAVRVTHKASPRYWAKDARQQSASFAQHLRMNLSGLPHVHMIVPPALMFGQFVAVYNTRSDGDVKIVITIHGINTYGTWQKEITPWLGMRGWIHWPIDYARFPRSPGDLAAFLVGHTPKRLMLRLREAYADISTDQQLSGFRKHVAIIAHSFGTKIVADGLSAYQHLLSFERFIFCGSIVGANYDWHDHVRQGRVQGVLNEYGAHDVWTRLYSVLHAEPMAGVVGFSNTPPAVVNRLRQLTHSDWFNRLQFEKVWVPYLETGATPP